jgi:hypothetical protein
MNTNRPFRYDESEEWLSSQARQLDRRDPPDDLWHRIETRMIAESVKSEIPAKAAGAGSSLANRLFRYFRRADARWNRVRISIAAAAVILLAVLSVPRFRQGLVSPLTGGSYGELARIDRDMARAERGFQKAIDRLARLARKNEKNIEPGLLALYREKLGLLDDSILACRMALEDNPGNPGVHAALLYSYRQKSETLRLMAGAKPLS